MKTLVGILLTVGLAVGYNQADAACKSKHMTHKSKMKTEKLALNKSSKLETRCVCHAVTKKTGMINARSYGGYKKISGGSPLMPTLNIPDTNLKGIPSDTLLRLREDQLNEDLNRKDNTKDIINNGWENSGFYPR